MSLNVMINFMDSLSRDLIRGVFIQMSLHLQYMPYATSDVCNSAQIHFNQEWNTMEELMAWLNGKPEQGQQSNSSALFLRHYNNYCTTN